MIRERRSDGRSIREGFDRECVDKIDAFGRAWGELQIGVATKSKNRDVLAVRIPTARPAPGPRRDGPQGRPADRGWITCRARPRMLRKTASSRPSTSSCPRRLYAIGDVLDGRPELTPVAIEAGLRLARASSALAMSMDYSVASGSSPLEYGAIGPRTRRPHRWRRERRVLHLEFTPLEHALSGQRSAPAPAFAARLPTDTGPES